MPKSKLTDPQQRAIDLLLGGMTQTEVAKLVGVSRQTITNWKARNALFRATLEGRRNERREAIAEYADGAFFRSVRYLDQLVADEGVEHTLRLKAAHTLTSRLAPTPPKEEQAAAGQAALFALLARVADQSPHLLRAALEGALGANPGANAELDPVE